MGAGGVGLAHVALGQAVVGKEHVVVRLGQIRRGNRVQRGDVVGVGVERLHRRHGSLGACRATSSITRTTTVSHDDIA
jgi:hypothetical protein